MNYPAYPIQPPYPAGVPDPRQIQAQAVYYQNAQPPNGFRPVQ